MQMPTVQIRPLGPKGGNCSTKTLKDRLRLEKGLDLKNLAFFLVVEPSVRLLVDDIPSQF